MIEPTPVVHTKAKLKLIEATLASLMQDGVDGCSVRKIAEHAGVSTGLINYHFESVHHLVAAAYQHLALQFLNNAIAVCATYEHNPRAQLSAFLQEIFSPQIMRRRVLRAWLVFWGLIDSTPAIQRAHEFSNSEFSTYLENLFTGLTAQRKSNLSPRLAAIGLTALIDGLWLEWCLQTDAYTPEECVRLCEHWVDAV